MVSFQVVKWFCRSLAMTYQFLTDLSWEAAEYPSVSIQQDPYAPEL